MRRWAEFITGVAAAHEGHTVIILETINGSQVRVQDVASGTKQSVPVSELKGIALGLSREDIQHRWESVRSSTRVEWLRARRRERVIRRLIRSDGVPAKEVASACRTLGLSRSSVYRLLARYRDQRHYPNPCKNIH